MMSQKQPVGIPDLQSQWVWLCWGLYVCIVLLSDIPPGSSLLHTHPDTLQEAVDLSLNFWYVMPLAFPQAAPTLSPTLEALFNVTVGWGLLFWGFAIDGRDQRWPILPFLIGTAFLTNVFYLPWLAIRQSNSAAPQTSLTGFEQASESRLLPATIGIVAIASVLWAVLGRPEFGDWTVRWAELQQTIASDRLAFSFAVDLLVFWIFQAWLVPDDMTRRGWDSRPMLWLARVIPFVGLIVYLFCRPRLTVAAD